MSDQNSLPDAPVYEYGEVIIQRNGVPVRVLHDPGGETLLVAVMLSGFLDPHKWVYKTDLRERERIG